MLRSRMVVIGGSLLSLSSLSPTVGLGGCIITVRERYDLTSYGDAVDLKVDSLRLVEKSGALPTAFATDIERLKVKAWKAYEYQVGKASPSLKTVKLWYSARESIDEFLKQWEGSAGGLSEEARAQMKERIETSINAVIQAEKFRVGE